MMADQRNCLRSFRAAVAALDGGSLTTRASVVMLGDSWIGQNMITSPVRERLQRQFGNAGGSVLGWWVHLCLRCVEQLEAGNAGNLDMNLSDAGLDLIISSEGKLKPLNDGRYIAYRCPAGVWTIYTGCTVGVKEGMIVTEAEGKAMFRRELDKHEAAVRRLVTVDITQSQFDALVSFSYNVGEGALSKSTLLKKLNKGDHAGACKEFMKWDKAAGRQLRGLTIRRAREAAMFATRENEPPAMAQAVMPPKEPITATQATIAAAPVAAGAVPAVQAVSEAIKAPALPGSG
jgi:lysozyme